MIARWLPEGEWRRLVGTEAEGFLSRFNPENARVRVVEEDGRIVGNWNFLRVVMAEGLSIAPSHRGSFGVAKGLLSGLRETAEEWGVDAVITHSIDPHVTELIQRWGGVPMPQAFALPALKPRRKVA